MGYWGKKNKRILLVNRDFQLRYARVAFLIGFITTLLTAFVILYPLYIFEILRVPRFLPFPILATMAVTILINVGALASMGILMTHRIAGPMHSLFREIRQVGRGNFCIELKSRPSDEFSYVFRNFNEMAESLKKMTAYDLALVDQIIAGVHKGVSKEEIERDLTDLRNRIHERIDEQRVRKYPTTIL